MTTIVPVGLIAHSNEYVNNITQFYQYGAERIVSTVAPLWVIAQFYKISCEPALTGCGDARNIWRLIPYLETTATQVTIRVIILHSSSYLISIVTVLRLWASFLWGRYFCPVSIIEGDLQNLARYFCPVYGMKGDLQNCSEIFLSSVWYGRGSSEL